MYNLTLEERKIISEFKAKNSWECFYCKKPVLLQNDVTVDHKLPVSRGGITIESNLAICCINCNREKADMTDDEYFLFRKKQKELFGTLGVNEPVNALISQYDSITNTFNQINAEYKEVEKNIKMIHEEIEFKSFSASEGYAFAKQLKEAIVRKNYLLHLLEAYKVLNCTVCNSKKQMLDAHEKIVKAISANSYNLIKESCLLEGRNIKKGNVIDIGVIKAM